MDLTDYIRRQKIWSRRTFGPGKRDPGLIDHIEKELREIEAAPGDLMEWVDVIILALDGAWRNGHSVERICDALEAKAEINRRRTWPDWKKQPLEPGKAVEHVKTEPKPYVECPRCGWWEWESDWLKGIQPTQCENCNSTLYVRSGPRDSQG